MGEAVDDPLLMACAYRDDKRGNSVMRSKPGLPKMAHFAVRDTVEARAI